MFCLYFLTYVFSFGIVFDAHLSWRVSQALVFFLHFVCIFAEEIAPPPASPSKRTNCWPTRPPKGQWGSRRRFRTLWLGHRWPWGQKSARVGRHILGEILERWWHNMYGEGARGYLKLGKTHGKTITGNHGTMNPLLLVDKLYDGEFEPLDVFSGTALNFQKLLGMMIRFRMFEINQILTIPIK